MVTAKLNLSMTEPQVRQIYAKQGDTGRVLDITLDQTPEDGTLRILRPDGVEVTSEAVTGGEVESGSTFESLAEADVTELSVGIEPVQDLSHGDPSPTNICPITGHDEVRVTRTGKNLITGFPSITQYGVTFTANADGSVTANGTATGGAATCLIGATRPIFTSILGKEVILSGCPSGGGLNTYRLQWWKYGVNSSGGTLTAADYGNGSDPFFPTETSGNIAIYINNGVTVNNLTFRPMVRLASETDDTYEPYRSNTYTTSLGQTVYGGTLDMVSGVLTVDKAMVDLGTLKWSKGNRNTADTGYVFYSASIASTISRDVTAIAYCSAYAQQLPRRAFWEALDEGQFQVEPYGNIVFVADYSDAPTFKTAMDGVQLVYKLASPQTYTLTPQQIQTLVGTNNVWASSGDIVSIKFAYGGLLSELPSDATSVVGKCYCDVEQNGVSSMPFTLNVKKNERES